MAKLCRLIDHPGGSQLAAAAAAGDAATCGPLPPSSITEAEMYGNFDIILDHFSHFSAPHHPIHPVGFTPRRAYTGRVLIGVWNPML